MSLPNVRTQHQAWDLALIGGVPTPGIATVSGAERVVKWDERDGKGADGASTFFEGAQLTKFTLTLSFADGVNGETIDEQIDRYQTFIVPVLEQGTSGKTALDFYYPSISEAPINVRSVVPDAIGQLAQDANGAWSVAIKLIQYVKPKAVKSGKPKNSAQKDAGKKTSTPVADEWDGKIKSLSDQLKAL